MDYHGTNSSSGSLILLTTGSTKQVKKQNIYDVAGNLWEQTLEASYSANMNYANNATLNSYMVRGGSFLNVQSSACFRGVVFANDTSSNYGFRPVIYFR